MPPSPPLLDVPDLLPIWDDLRHRGQGFALRVWGRSMLPTIRPGTVVEVEPCGPAELRVGDVALVRGGDRVVIAHRVVSIGAGGFVTRGDWHLRDDPESSWDDLLGRVVALGEGRARRDLDPRLWRALAPALVPALALLRRAYGAHGRPVTRARALARRLAALTRGDRVARALGREPVEVVPLGPEHLSAYRRFLMRSGAESLTRQDALALLGRADRSTAVALAGGEVVGACTATRGPAAWTTARPCFLPGWDDEDLAARLGDRARRAVGG